METLFFGIAFTAYTMAMSLYIGYAATRREVLSTGGKWVLWLAIFAHAASLVVRTIQARQMPQHEWYVPWSNWFESFSFFTIVIAVEFLIIQRKESLPILGAVVTPLTFITMIVALNSPFGRQIPTLPPALQSYWMAVHVPVMFVAYAAFANAFVVGIAYLFQEWQVKSKRPSQMVYRLPPLDQLDNLICKIIGWAFPILTVGILLGARWAYDAWGRYWGWDAKETWAFISWLVYAIYLYMRLIVGWRGRKTAFISIAGFLVVVITYVGVNYLSELHGFLSNTGR